jgi:ribosome-binding protein aMBF1 (putative translation factor)
MPISSKLYTDDETAFLRNTGFNIQCVRKKHNLSQEGLAEAANISLSMIRRLESSVACGASLVVLRRIAKALGVSLCDLLDDT